MTVNANLDSPEYSPDPYAYAMRHLDEAEEKTLKREERWGGASAETAEVHALIGIGWALLAIARKR